MIPLDNTSSAWRNYSASMLARFNDLGRMITPESMTDRLAEYNGIVVDPAASVGWQPYFKTEQDLQWFLLKWS